MHLPIRKLVLLFAAAVALASCASIQRAQDQGRIDKIARLINSGEAEKLTALSAVPFLLDQEIIPLRADIAGFWKDVVKAGYKVAGPELEKGSPVSADSYRVFADTMEAKAFFARYVKKGARVLELSTGDGRKIVLLVRDTLFSRTLYGFKGPF
ncbi:MAG: hypothetical protein IMZ54_12155 [Acidobacteria bacterium]|nr:hypothetical protein [Spirochaetota bacterium]MBE3131451.1 hypothetical protein [Acidobacteriota bacterium]